MQVQGNGGRLIPASLAAGMQPLLGRAGYVDAKNSTRDDVARPVLVAINALGTDVRHGNSRERGDPWAPRLDRDSSRKTRDVDFVG